MSIKPVKKERSPNDVDRLVGRNVRRLRTERGLTLVDVAVALKISHQQLQKYETGANRLSAGMISNLSEALSVPIETLFVRPGQPARGRSRSQSGALDELRQQGLFCLERTRSESTLQKMVDILKILASKP